MMTIWKFALPLNGVVLMPYGAQPLSAASQNGDDVTIWALVDPNAVTEVARFFRVVGTGEQLGLDPRDVKFIGTVLLHGGRFVYHVFDTGEAK